MKKGAIVVLVIFGVWALVSWRWYTCGIKGFCGEKMLEETIIPTPVREEVMVSDPMEGLSDAKEEVNLIRKNIGGMTQPMEK